MYIGPSSTNTFTVANRRQLSSTRHVSNRGTPVKLSRATRSVSFAVNESDTDSRSQLEFEAVSDSSPHRRRINETRCGRNPDDSPQLQQSRRDSTLRNRPPELSPSSSTNLPQPQEPRDKNPPVPVPYVRPDFRAIINESLAQGRIVFDPSIPEMLSPPELDDISITESGPVEPITPTRDRIETSPVREDLTHVEQIALPQTQETNRGSYNLIFNHGGFLRPLQASPDMHTSGQRSRTPSKAVKLPDRRYERTNSQRRYEFVARDWIKKECPEDILERFDKSVNISTRFQEC